MSQQVNEHRQAFKVHKRQELASDYPQDSMQGFSIRDYLPHLGRPQVMTADRAKAQGIFIPNWWLAILLIPILLGVLWFFKSQSDIQAAQITAERLRAADAEAARMQFQAMKDTLEYRLRSIETQGKLNDEHTRQLEKSIARIEGKKGISPLEEQ